MSPSMDQPSLSLPSEATFVSACPWPTLDGQRCRNDRSVKVSRVCAGVASWTRDVDAQNGDRLKNKDGVAIEPSERSTRAA